MLIQVWKDSNGLGVMPKPNADALWESGHMCINAVLVREYEAKTWYEAMCKHHEFQGWGEYNPPRLMNGDIDPVVLQPLDDV